MNTKILGFYFILNVVLFSTLNCQSKQSGSTDKQVIIMLKDFYTSYITENAKMPPDFSKINSIKNKYCTSTFLHKLETDKLDYDPFLNAQDCDTEWLKTLLIKMDTEKNLYQVSYKDISSGTQVVIKLIVKKENKVYKIDAIR